MCIFEKIMDFAINKIYYRVAVGLLFLGIISTGCAKDVANRYYSAESYPPKAVEQVDILHSKPNRSFIVIADFQSRGESPEDYRRKAAEIGADAVIVTYIGGYYSTDEQWARSDRYQGCSVLLTPAGMTGCDPG